MSETTMADFAFGDSVSGFWARKRALFLVSRARPLFFFPPPPRPAGPRFARKKNRGLARETTLFWQNYRFKGTLEGFSIYGAPIT